MPSFYVTSLESGAGKTAVAAGLTGVLLSRGRRAGYVKPAALDGLEPDRDTAFLRRALPAAVPQDEPLVLATGQVRAGLGQAAQEVRQRIARAAQGQDIVVIDGLSAGPDTASASAEMANLADALVIGVVRYTRGLDAAAVVTLKETFGKRLEGVILNAVPRVSLRAARDETVPALSRVGIPVLAMVPEDRVLLGFTVAEYGMNLGGRIINNEEKADLLVENLLVGANVTDDTTEYYERIPNKALITRGDRPDLQWNALETSTRCLILTRNTDPIPYVLNKAEDEEVPVLVVPKDTLETLAQIEGFITRPTFHHPEKLARFTRALDESLDLETLSV